MLPAVDSNGGAVHVLWNLLPTPARAARQVLVRHWIYRAWILHPLSVEQDALDEHSGRVCVELDEIAQLFTPPVQIQRVSGGRSQIGFPYIHGLL